MHTARVGPDEPFDRPGAGGLDPGDVADLAVEGLDDDAAEIARAVALAEDTEEDLELELENPDIEAFDDEAAARRAYDALGEELGMDLGLEDGEEGPDDEPAGDVDPLEVPEGPEFEDPPEAGDDGLERWESLEPLDGPHAPEGEDLVLEDGSRIRIRSYYHHSGTVSYAPVDEDGNAPYSEREDGNWDDLSGRVEGVVDSTPEPDDLTREERFKAAEVVAGGALSGAGGAVEDDWVEYGEVLDRMSDEDLRTALVDEVLTAPEETLPGAAKGDAPLELVMGAEYSRDRDNVTLNSMTNGRDLACLMSRMEGDSLEDAIDEIFERAPEDGIEGAEVYSRISDPADSRADALSAVYNAAVAFAPTQEARESIAEKHDPPEEGYHGGENSAAGMAAAGDFDDFKSAWIQGWYPSGDTDAAALTGLALEGFRSNEGTDAFGWTHGRPIGDVDTERMEEHFETMYQETQEQLESTATGAPLHRGVGGSVTTHSALESWTSRRDIAGEFGDHVMKADVDDEDVLATWQTLGDEWPEEDVKGKEEWMVLGGALE